MTETIGELAARYRDDGYVVREVLTLNEVDALHAEIAAVCRGERGEVDGLEPVPAGTSDEQAVEQVLCINHPHKVSSFIAERFAHRAIVEVLKGIIGPNVKAVNCVVFNRHPDNPGPVVAPRRVLHPDPRPLVGPGVDRARRHHA